MKNLQSNIAAIPQNIGLITGRAKELGFKKVLKGIFDDFFGIDRLAFVAGDSKHALLVIAK